MADQWREVTPGEISEADPDAQLRFGHYRPNLLQSALIALGRGTILRRGAFRGGMTRLILNLGRRPLDIRWRGAAYRVRGEHNLIENALLLNPYYNATDIEFLLDGSEETSCFLDIGSNIGLYTLPLALAAPKGTTLAIDANPKMITRLNWNAAATGADNVRIVHAAVSDREGQGDLKIRKDDVAIVAVEETGTGAMPLRPLAALVAEAGITAIHGLKIDIEGHEDKALVPFLDAADPALLPRRIVIEHPEPDADYPGCTAAFARHGYSLVKRTRNNSLYRLGS